MKRFDSSDLNGLERFFRGNLVNCLTGTKPAALIGTRSFAGTNNLALFSNIFHLGADPAMIGLVQRPLTNFSHTYRNIRETGWFTVNHIKPSLAAKAHHTSAKFEDGVDEFVACGIEEEFFEGVPAPFVRHSAIRFAAKFLREIQIEENGTRLLLAGIDAVFIDEGLLLADGNIDPSNNNVMAVVGLENYYTVSPLARFSYAKPDVIPVNGLK